MPHERFQCQTTLGYRGDAIVEFDWCVGELTAALDRLGLAEKTLVVLCSDNGPVLDDGYKDGAVEKLGDHKPAGPFSGGKYSIREGGTRTPFIARWKGRIEPGVSDEVVSTIDLPASFAALAGVPLPQDAFTDSFNVLGALLGEEGARGRDHLVQQDNGRAGNFGLRAGRWKLHRHGKQAARARYQLFDLSEDPAEKHDVLADHPEVADRLKTQLDEIINQGRSRK
jgi:arylsulfatase A